MADSGVPEATRDRWAARIAAFLRLNLVRKLLSLLNSRERARLYFLLLGVVVIGLLDIAGISSILPFMAIVAKPSSVEEISILKSAYAYSGASSVNGFLFLLGCMSLTVVLLSNLVAFAVQRAILKFSFRLSRNLSTRVLGTYLDQPYQFFLDRNTSTLMTNVVGEVEGVVNGVLVPGLQVVAKLVAAAFVLLTVFIVDPLLSLVFLSLFGCVYGVLILATKKRINFYGRQSQSERREMMRVANEALHSVKELKLLGREKQYHDRFGQLSQRLAGYQITYNTIAAVPRYVIEVAAFGAIIFVVLFLLWRGRDLQTAIPLLVLYAFAGYRLMPAFQALFQNLTMMRFNWPSVEALSGEVAALPQMVTPGGTGAGDRAPLEFVRAVELRDVTFQYPHADRAVLDRFNLAIQKNTTVGFVGATGAGKTTIVDILLGILSPTRGHVVVDDVVVDGSNVRRWQALMGYVSQTAFLSDSSFAGNIAFGIAGDQIDMELVRKAARAAQLHDFVMTLPKGYDTPIGEKGVKLSGGQRQRVAIARALYHDPAVLVFDEATNALDGLTEEAVVNAIRTFSHEKTIIMIAHRLTTVVDCDVIHVLDRGRIVDSGSFKDLAGRNELFREMARMSDG